MYRKNTFLEKVILTNARDLLTKVCVDVGYLHKCNSGMIFYIINLFIMSIIIYIIILIFI